jgi:hypothetical protein
MLKLSNRKAVVAMKRIGPKDVDSCPLVVGVAVKLVSTIAAAVEVTVTVSLTDAVSLTVASTVPLMVGFSDGEDVVVSFAADTEHSFITHAAITASKRRYLASILILSSLSCGEVQCFIILEKINSFSYNTMLLNSCLGNQMLV